MSAVLPVLAVENDWVKFAIACTALAIIAAPTSVVPLLLRVFSSLAPMIKR